MVHDRGHLYRVECIHVDQVLYACHRAVVAAGKPAQLIMRFAQTVDGNRNGAHSYFGKALGNFGCDERGVARHAPAEALFVGVAHDVEEVTVEKRLAACDAQLHARDVEVSFDLVDDAQPFVARQVVDACKSRRA